LNNNVHTELSDNDLIIRFLKDGDENAFEILYRRYREPLFAYLNRLAPEQSSLVDDLYQQTWIRIISSLRRYREKQRFLAWAMRIAHNIAMDYFRKNKRFVFTEKEDVFESVTDENQPWQELSGSELKEALDSAVRELPPDQREVFLFRQNGISFREIADIQDIGLSTALGRMRYAVSRLQLLLNDWKE